MYRLYTLFFSLSDVRCFLHTSFISFLQQSHSLPDQLGLRLSLGIALQEPHGGEISVYLRGISIGCNTVYLWRSKPLLWTQLCPLQHSGLSIFQWTITLRMIPFCTANKINHWVIKNILNLHLKLGFISVHMHYRSIFHWDCGILYAVSLL